MLVPKYELMQVLNYTKLRNNLKAVIDSVSNDKDTVIVNRGDTNVVIVSLDEYNSWKETEYLMSTEANRKRLAQAIERVEKGITEQHDLIEE